MQSSGAGTLCVVVKDINNRDRNYTSAKVKRRLEQIEESIARYLFALDTADRQEAEITSAKAGRLNKKIEILKQQMQRLREIEAKLKDAPDGQISLTDPDARSMATSGRGTGIVGYNVQTAVDAKHHLEDVESAIAAVSRLHTLDRCSPTI